MEISEITAATVADLNKAKLVNLMVLKQATDLIESQNLSGTNYLMVYGVGNPTQNAAELQLAYNAAKTMPRYLGTAIDRTTNDIVTAYVGQTFDDAYVAPGQYLIATNTIINGAANLITGNVITEAQAKAVRTVLIKAPGDYRGATPFVHNTSGIDLISLTGEPDVILNATITTTDSLLKGIKLSTGSFPTPTGAGKIINCVDGSNAVINYPSIAIPSRYTKITLLAALAANVDLQGINLAGLNLDSAGLGGAILIGANLIGANFTSASLDSANLTGANLTGATLVLTNCTLTNLTGANLTGANLTSVAAFDFAIINKANFTGVTGLNTDIGVALGARPFGTLVTWTNGKSYTSNGTTWALTV